MPGLAQEIEPRVARLRDEPDEVKRISLRAEIRQALLKAMQESMGGFKLENGGSLLARHFFAVERCDLPASLVFQTSQPVLDYVNSMRALRERHVHR